jgi:hypothetical protein
MSSVENLGRKKHQPQKAHKTQNILITLSSVNLM